MADEFDTPDEAPPKEQGEYDRLNWKDPVLKGALLMIEPYSFEEKVVTQFAKSGKDAVRADVSIIDGKLGGRFYENQLIFGVRLVDQLRSKLNKKVLARFELIPTGNGNMGQLNGAVTEQDKAEARKFKRPDEFSSPAVTDDDTPPF